MKGRATRGDGLHLVPSQITERHQATTPPLDYWGEPGRAVPWALWARRAAVVFAFVYLILVWPWAMTWPQEWRVVGGIVAFSIGVSALDKVWQ